MTLDSTHPSDDDLMLALSGDRSQDAHDAVAHHVAGCDRCRAVQAEIAGVLALVSSAPVPDPGDGFEARMWARIQPALAPASTSSWQARHLMPVLAWAAAIGGVVVGGYLAAPRLAPTPEPATASAAGPSTGDASDTRERVLLAAVDAHLART
jgi:anti-sigma factor RsiW